MNNQASADAPDRDAPKKRWIAAAVGYVISIACLLWVYHEYPWREELPKFLEIDWRWVAVAVVFEVLTYFAQGFRWSMILRPVSKVPILQSTKAVFVGIFVNEILPLRGGEILRCFLLSRWAGIRLGIVFSSAVIERVVDGVWLLLFFLGATMMVDLPPNVMVGVRILTVVIFVLAAGVLVATLSKRLAHRLAHASSWTQKIATFVLGFNALGKSRSFLWAALISFFYLGFQVVPFHALFVGYGLELSIFASTAVLIVTRLGTIAPQGPGNVGVLQALIVLGLGIFGVEQTKATTLATILFAVINVPLLISGFLAVLITGMNLGELRREAAEHTAQSKRETT
jgi:uncharacterized protein (TIRG00374 family)